MIRSLDPDSGLADNPLNRWLDDPKSALGGTKYSGLTRQDCIIWMD